MRTPKTKMEISQYRLHGFILLLVMFLSSMFSLASNMYASFHGNRKRIMSGSIQAPSSEPGAYEYTVCSDHSEAEGKPQRSSFDCEKGDVLSAIKFADYGQATGSCENYKRGKCGARNTLSIVKKKCIGKRKCELLAPDKLFGPTHCNGTIRLVIEATCKKT